MHVATNSSSLHKPKENKTDKTAKVWITADSKIVKCARVRLRVHSYQYQCSQKLLQRLKLRCPLHVCVCVRGMCGVVVKCADEVPLLRTLASPNFFCSSLCFSLQFALQTRTSCYTTAGDTFDDQQYALVHLRFLLAFVINLIPKLGMSLNHLFKEFPELQDEHRLSLLYAKYVTNVPLTTTHAHTSLREAKLIHMNTSPHTPHTQIPRP